MPIKHFTRAVAALILFSSSTISALANEHDKALATMDKVYSATINSYYSINSFYNFSANQADQEQQKQVLYSVGVVEDLMIDISGLLSNSPLKSQVDSARDAWLAYEDSLNENIEVVNDTGYTDLRLVGDLANLNISFNDSLNILYKSIAEESGITTDEELEKTHNTAKLAALIMTKYSARSTSTVSQVYSREDDSDTTLDQLATQFNQQLNELAEKQSDKDAAKLLDSAKTKWEFIQPSLINYNENRVNFVVNLYTKKIIENLQEASAI